MIVLILLDTNLLLVNVSSEIFYGGSRQIFLYCSRVCVHNSKHNMYNTNDINYTFIPDLIQIKLLANCALSFHGVQDIQFYFWSFSLDFLYITYKHLFIK